MENREKSTEWALLFPLKAGLFAMKSSLSSKSVSRGEREREMKERLLRKNQLQQPRARIRRGSSLSDLDKLQSKAILPDVVKSTEIKCSESLPHSPALSNLQLAACSSSVRGSIGDLMNMKKYGGSTWSVRSETLIAKAVPLSTVTAKQSPTFSKSVEDDLECELSQEDESSSSPISGKPLTSAQRTQRLSRLIRKQRRMMVFNPSSIPRETVSRPRCESGIYRLPHITVGKV